LLFNNIYLDFQIFSVKNFIASKIKSSHYINNHLTRKQHTKGGPLMAKHNPLPISERPKSFGVCSTHQDTKMELYCQECNIPLCVYCKINGHHSQGDNNGHKLVKITDAYSKALRDSKDYDPLLEKRKNHLAECLSKIDNKIKEINKNAASLEEQIYKKL
jgi:hypothetical protein